MRRAVRRPSVRGEGSVTDPWQDARGRLYVYVSSAPECTDRVQTVRFYQRFMEAAPGNSTSASDSPLSGPLWPPPKAQEESNSHTSTASPHWAQIWTRILESLYCPKKDKVSQICFSPRLTSSGLIKGRVDYLCYASSQNPLLLCHERGTLVSSRSHQGKFKAFDNLFNTTYNELSVSTNNDNKKKQYFWVYIILL